ncbi:MAG: T9SS type A sorting domain-containing protein, partial [Crocinitomicaceae bacterium]|nr:T9SS type A sorting domain-containing protein [Crocinitomicaceae bacterium]
NLIEVIDTNEIFMAASSLTQRDTLLYVALGGVFGSSDPTGMVIIDVADPTNPIVLDEWIAPFGNGTGIIQIQGDYAYVGGMAEGLIILKISDPNSISFVSQLIPDVTFPYIDNDTLKVNARGMTVVDNLVYLCYDAGGVRIIDCADINNPVQIGEFANPITLNPPNDWPRAYNNIVVEDTVAYVAVDYCGMESWSIADPANAALLSHWNPIGCPTGNWFGSPVHTNEIVAQFECDILFVSAGSSDLLVIDISDPYSLVAIDSFGTTLDTAGSWGLDVTDDYIYIAYIRSFVPFVSHAPGVKQLSYTKCAVGIGEIKEEDVVVYPNPTNKKFQVNGVEGDYSYELIDLRGSVLLKGNAFNDEEVDVQQVNAGAYILLISADGIFLQRKIIIE